MTGHVEAEGYRHIARWLDECLDFDTPPGPQSLRDTAKKLHQAADRIEELTTRTDIHQAALDRIAELEKGLEELACRHVTSKPLWWQAIARAALAKGDG